MLTLKKEFEYPIGYSDHTKGSEIALMAVAYGATVIEKHFTYDKNAEGPDHQASLEPEELQHMVDAIRHIELAKGDGKKEPTQGELSTREVARKSLVWSRKMSVGEVVKKEDLCCKRPGTGIQPQYMDKVIGCMVIKECDQDSLVNWDEVNGDGK